MTGLLGLLGGAWGVAAVAAVLVGAGWAIVAAARKAGRAERQLKDQARTLANAATRSEVEQEIAGADAAELAARLQRWRHK